MNHSTIQYYEDHADEFAANTIDADMEEMRSGFQTYLPTGASILDFGCGTGRDTKAFREMGYEVAALDGSEADVNEMVWHSIRNLMDMADRATKKLKKRTDKTQSENLKLAKKLEKLQKDKEKCETERFSNVDRFMAGELEKDDYLRVRQELSRKAECLNQQIADVTVKLHESEAAADDGVREAVATMKKYSGERNCPGRSWRHWGLTLKSYTTQLLQCYEREKNKWR